MSRHAVYQILAEKDLRCAICELSLEKEWEELQQWKKNPKSIKRTSINIDLDHIVPKRLIKDQKWKNGLENLQLTHRTCNNRKGGEIIYN